MLCFTSKSLGHNQDGILLHFCPEIPSESGTIRREYKQISFGFPKTELTSSTKAEFAVLFFVLLWKQFQKKENKAFISS